MQVRTTVFLVLLGAAVGIRSAARRLENDDQASLSENPIQKVTKMLQDMEAELQAEMDDDKEVYETLKCWCESGTDEKTKSIQLAKAAIPQLESSIAQANGGINEKKAKLIETKKEIQSDQDALATSKEMRMKESKEFHAEEMDLMEAVKATAQAVTTLGKHHSELAQVKAVAKMLDAKRIPELLVSSRIASEEHAGTKLLRSFIQGANSASALVQIPGMQSYAPQSGQIFGILKQMGEDFKNSLKDAQENEKKAQEEHQTMVAAKNDEIAAGKEQVTTLDEEVATLMEKVAEYTTELADTQKKLAEDEEFLASLQSKCATADQEYEERTKSRLTEMSAVQDTIKIVNSEESFNHFAKTMSFVQVNEVSESRKRVVTMLQNGASKLHSMKLFLLSVSAQVDVFAKVREQIEKLIKELEKTQLDELATKDLCRKELHENARNMAAGYDEQAALKTKIAELEKQIEDLTNKIHTAEEEIKVAEAEMISASQLREKENGDFKQIVADQRVTQGILDKALKRMKEVYFIQAPPHTQTSATATDPGNGPAKFSKMEANAGGGKVVAMLEDVIADSKKAESEALRGEADAQNGYEAFMKNSNKAIKTNMEALANMNEAKAKAEEDLGLAKTDFKNVNKELFGLDREAHNLHKSCDFLLENFEARQKARNEEIGIMEEAENVLAGMAAGTYK